MNITIDRTIDDGSIRAAAILQTQGELHHAFDLRSAQLNKVACLTLVQTSAGVRTLLALVDHIAPYADAEARLEVLVEQARRCGLETVSDGLLVAWRSRGRMRVPELIG